MRKLFLLLMLMFLFFLILACEEKSSPPGGVVEVKLNLLKNKKGVSSYIIAGAGPGEKVFYESNVRDTVFKRKLVPGTWKISIDGLDSKGKVAARGYATVNIVDGKAIVAPVRIRKLKGYGKIIVNALLSQTKFPRSAKIEGELWQIGRRPIKLEFDPKSNTLSYNKYLWSGYFDLIIRVKRYRRVLCGAVKTIKILNGGRTEVSIDIIDVNKINFSIESSPRFISPNKVSIVNDRNISVGKAINIHTNHTLPGDVVISWYINGQYVQNGNIYSIDRKFNHGVYRLDVSVFTLNSKKGASATSMIQVLKNMPHAPGSIYKCMSLKKFNRKSI